MGWSLQIQGKCRFGLARLTRVSTEAIPELGFLVGPFYFGRTLFFLLLMCVGIFGSVFDTSTLLLLTFSFKKKKQNGGIFFQSR